MKPTLGLCLVALLLGLLLYLRIGLGSTGKALEGVEAGGLIKLEDADYATAQEVVRAVRWANRHPDYIALADAFGI